LRTLLEQEEINLLSFQETRIGAATDLLPQTAVRDFIAEHYMDLGCGLETWDTRLTLDNTIDNACSRGDVVVSRDAWESEPWFESSLTAMPCTHDLALESSALEPRAGSDLGFLMPSYSVWEWEKFDLPEIIGDEFERCLQWHNLNAARLQYTVAVEVELCVYAIRKQIFPSPESGASSKASVSGRAAGRAPQGLKRTPKCARMLSRPEARMLAATQKINAPRRKSFQPFWRPVSRHHAQTPSEGLR
jgi:hypothetical protein